MKNAITCHFSSVRQLPTPPASAASAIGIYFATMFASSLARTAARRAATATPMRLGALRAMSSETATFDLTGSFEVRHVSSHCKEMRGLRGEKQKKRKTHGCAAVWLVEWNARPCLAKMCFSIFRCVVRVRLYLPKEKLAQHDIVSSIGILWF